MNHDRRRLIVLLEPVRPPGFVSGGYRYQDEVMARLAARGLGRQVAIASDQLAFTVAAALRAGEIVVVDGLFVEHLGVPLPDRIVPLLHTVPALDPWCERPLHVIATAAPTADAVRGTARSVTVIRPGLDECFRPPATPPRNQRLRVLCVGTVCEPKGQRLVALSLATSAARTDCELILIGDTATEPHYVASVKRAAGQLPITMRGVLSPAQVAGELQQADLFVSASRRESFGMAVAEAAACGAPVLAFDTGEIAACVGREGAGRLLDPRTTDAEFGQRLAELLENPAALRHSRTTAIRPQLADWDAVAAAFAETCSGIGSSR